MQAIQKEIPCLTENSSFTKRVNKDTHSISSQKKIRKIIRHLRDDLERIFPNEVLPSSWMIRCLVSSCYSPHSKLEEWDQSVMSVLKAITQHTSTAYGISSVFYEEDGVTPLFPNQELFGPQHAHSFALLAQKYLAVQLGHTQPTL